MNQEQAKATLPVMLKDLRLPTFLTFWEGIGHQADVDGWGSARYLATLCENEIQARNTRQMARKLKESGLVPSKSLATFDFGHVPMINKTHIQALGTGDIWIKQGGNILIFGPSGVGKTHLAHAIGIQLIEHGIRVLVTRTTELVQKLQSAKQMLALPSALKKLDKYDCLICDDIGYARRDSHETNVLFELISERYERKSMIITCNQPFSEWDNIFQDKAMAVAAIDRLVHNATILQINVESFRKASALKKMENAKGLTI